MSAALYALGRWCFLRGKTVLAGWLLIGALLGGLVFAFQGSFREVFEVPGSSSAEALTRLHMTFPQGTRMTADALITSTDGTALVEHRAEIEDGLAQFLDEELVDTVRSPWAEQNSGPLSEDGMAAMATIVLGVDQVVVKDLESLEARAEKIRESLPQGIDMQLGGQAFSIDLPQVSSTEVIGVVLSLLVLWIMLGSLLTALVPIFTSLLGVGLSMALMFLSANIIDVSSVTPMLALMLGTAVGLDYGLFIYTRHRDQLRDGAELEESIAVATGTAGTAVIFAGLTNTIALLGLAVANIPFITVMGVFASLAVVFAVAIALTGLPAFAGFLGERMRPKTRKTSPEKRFSSRFFRSWVTATTRHPIITIVAVISVLGAATVPAFGLTLSLPNTGQNAPETTTRRFYDLTAQRFGPGYNKPLIVMAEIVSSSDPLGLIEELSDEIAAVPGVAKVTMATPNQNADTALIQLVADTAIDDPATAETVGRLRELTDSWVETHGIRAEVTGFSAIQLDVTERLGGAVLPFGLLVVGLTLVLLCAVFRSVWVPIKTAVGFLLSVGAALGITQLVFNQGWAKEVVNIDQPMAVTAFLPVLLLAILFGLAMDYEIFIVSRIREAYIRGADPVTSIRTGFVSSGPVVSSVALVMIAIFSFFVPSNLISIKQIAFALAVGVAADAFLVRMTLVPAVLALLGKRAWWMPAWLDRVLPEFDMEGEVLARQLALAHWPGTDAVLHAEDLAVKEALAPVSLSLTAGEIAVFAGQSRSRCAALLALSGRLRSTSGRARVAGELLPDASRRVQLRTRYFDLTEPRALAALDRAKPGKTEVWFVDGLDELTSTKLDAALDRLNRAAQDGTALCCAATPTTLGGVAIDRIVTVTAEADERNSL